MRGPFIREVQLTTPEETDARRGHPWDLPAVAALKSGLALDPGVTYLIGANGSGKSTLLEAIAVAAGMNAEGGSSNFAFSTRNSHSELWRSIRLVRAARRPQTDFFLRAESLFTTATYLEELPRNPLQAYGDVSLHEQSHGESFLAVMVSRFGPNGLYLLDEPEAALSTQNCLTCLRRIHELVLAGSQFIIATHSPILMAFPDAEILVFEGDRVTPTPYDELDHVRLTRAFLNDPESYLRRL